jgi:hypothetical protein
MANFVFDYAMGRWVGLYGLPLGSDTITVVLVQSTGLPSDSTLAGYQYLSQVWSGGGIEATFTNYSRQTITSSGITIGVNTGTGTATVSVPSQVWNAAGGATNNTLGALLTCYQPTSISADSSIQLLTKHNFAATTTGGNLTAVITSVGTVT